MYPPPLPHPPPLPPRRHSGFGIGSFVIALAAGVALFVLVAVAGYLEFSTPGGVDENSVTATLFGLLMLGAGLLLLLGVALGIAGAMDREHKRVFAVLGLGMNALVLAGVVALLILGNAGD
jgi:hypothetical protein